jgi:predicted ester cyclase
LEIGGLKPTGKSIDKPVACIFDIDNDKLICEKVYFDMATLMKQLTA